MRTEILRAARIERGRYRCVLCLGLFGPREVRVDHIDPVVPLSGFVSWDDYVGRLFHGAQQVACVKCHSIKTKEERLLREGIRRRLKKD